MPEITNPGKLFFYKNRCRLAAYLRAVFEPRAYVSITREIIRLKSGRRTEHLVAVDVTPVPMTGLGFFAIRRHDCSAPRRQT
jgi:hypothetical protein